MDPTRAVQPSDDIESIFHVLLYQAMRFMGSNCLDTDVCAWMTAFFDDSSPNGGTMLRGQMKNKYMAMTSGLLEVRDKDGMRIRLEFNNRYLDILLEIMMKHYKRYYAQLDDAVPGSMNKTVINAFRSYQDQEDPPVGLTDRADAVKNHKLLLELIATGTAPELRSDWPTDDKVGDRLKKSKGSLKRKCGSGYNSNIPSDTDSKRSRP